MWKKIKDWENFYEINENGEIRNIKTNKLIIGDINNVGYPRVCLYHTENGKQIKKRYFRHRLVAQHFIDNPNNLPEVNHKDNNKLNCNVDNLEWCTREENERQSHASGNKPYRPFVVIWINGNQELFDTSGQLARKIKISGSLIRLWLKGISKTFLNYNIKSIYYITLKA
jgi:hypothetical protein